MFVIERSECLDQSIIMTNATSPASDIGLGDLPPEILLLICAFAALSPPPSQRALYEAEPSHAHLSSELQPLKRLSCVSRTWRALVLPLLFKCTRLELWNVPWERDDHEIQDCHEVRDFLQFLKAAALTPHVASILISTSPSIRHYELHTPTARQTIFPYGDIPTFDWLPLFSCLDLKEVTILAPYNFIVLLTSAVWGHKSWWSSQQGLFQVLRLKQTAQDHKATETAHAENKSLMNESHIGVNLLNMRPWTRLSVNEGSCIGHYTRYHFHLLDTESLIPALVHLDYLATLRSNLTSVTYTAVFPPQLIIDGLLKLAKECHAPASLDIQLAPSADSTIIEREKGNLDLRDLWLEAEIEYHNLWYQLQTDPEIRLDRFVSRDFSHDTGIRRIMPALGELLVGWKKLEAGSWVRETDEDSQPAVSGSAE